jgi:hypothetical protein
VDPVKSVQVRAVANNNPLAQISERLANSLGLTQFHDIFVEDALYSGIPALRWKVSVMPMTINYHGKSVALYPIVSDSLFGK